MNIVTSMFYFSKDAPTDTKSAEPVCIEMQNPFSDEKNNTSKTLFYMQKKDFVPEPLKGDRDMKARIKRRIPPKKIGELDKYYKRLEEYNLDNGFKIKSLTDNVFMPTPKANGREIIVVAAPSGAGKSVFCNQYLKLFNKLHPDRKIYIISHLSSDPSLENGLERQMEDGIVERLKIDAELVDEYEANGGFDISEFKNACILCDDYDSINDKKIRSFIEHILDACMKIGRHENINLLITSHLLYSSGGAKHNRIILSEANSFVVFPSRSTMKALKHLCGTYLGLDQSKIQDMRTWQDRYVFINKSPCYIIGQHRAEVI